MTMRTAMRRRGLRQGAEPMPRPAPLTIKAIDWALTDETRLAMDFLTTVTTPRLPWLERFEEWADARALGPGVRRVVRTTVVKLRMQGR